MDLLDRKALERFDSDWLIFQEISCGNDFRESASTEAEKSLHYCHYSFFKGPAAMQESCAPQSGGSMRFSCPILTKSGENYLYSMHFWKVLPFFKILKFRVSYGDS